MYGALRWIESRGGENLVAIGREGLTSLYEKAGFASQGKKADSGAVTFEQLVGNIKTSRDRLEATNGLARRLDRVIEWNLEIPMDKPTSAFHGGAFFDAIGHEFDDLTRVKKVISADVLDAWFPPSPKVVEALQNNLNWTITTSPPTDSEGLIARIADVRGLNPKLSCPGRDLRASYTAHCGISSKPIPRLWYSSLLTVSIRTCWRTSSVASWTGLFFNETTNFKWT